MSANHNSILILISSLILGGILINDAYAYIDPGSASIFLQGMIGVLVGAAIAVKIYWFKIKEKISSLKKD